MILWAQVALVLATTVAMVLAPPGGVAETSAALETYSASGRALQVIGPDPFDLDSTRGIDGSVTVRMLAASKPGRVALVAEFGPPAARYRVDARTLSARYRTPTQTAVPALAPRLTAWGYAEVTRNGRRIAARAPIAVTVLADPPIMGISLEIATMGPALPRVPDGYLHVMWHDPATLSFGGPVTARARPRR